MRVSIITTCYNRERTIREAIESVLMQDYDDIEYIVVDGASKDHSMEIINEYRDRIAIIISERDGGMYEAINKGIRASSGDLIGVVHSDDFLYSSSTISRVVDHIVSCCADLIYGNGLFVDSSDSSKIIRNWHSGEFRRRSIRNGWLPLHPTVYIRRGWFERLGLYDESYRIAADSDLLVRYIYMNHLRVSYLDDYIIKMRMGGLSTDPRRMFEKWGEDLRLYRESGFNPYWALGCKIISKIPQFILAKFIKK